MATRRRAHELRKPDSASSVAIREAAGLHRPERLVSQGNVPTFPRGGLHAPVLVPVTARYWVTGSRLAVIFLGGGIQRSLASQPGQAPVHRRKSRPARGASAERASQRLGWQCRAHTQVRAGKQAKSRPVTANEDDYGYYSSTLGGSRPWSWARLGGYSVAG